MSFSDDYLRYDLETIATQIEAHSSHISETLVKCYSNEKLEQSDLCALLSPAALPYLEEIVAISTQYTRQRFGNIIQFYAPLYLSNYCHSTCTYCGFSRPNQIHRLTLSVEQAYQEAQLLYQNGIRHLLLLSGEDYKQVPMNYLKEIIQLLAPQFASLAIEVYPLEKNDYTTLQNMGLDGVVVYQETYDAQRYSQVHLGGMKKRMLWRLDCPDRAAQAGIRHIGLGALLGLSSQSACDVFLLATHARYLMRHYWQSEISISLPRLRPAVGLETPPLINDTIYWQYLCALRLFLPQAAIHLSTRESASFRDTIAGTCVTHMSAASKTEPGGYSGQKSTRQFETSDTRSLSAIEKAIEKQGMQSVTTDWSPVLK